MICPHCKMLTTPMGGECEFCGEDVRRTQRCSKCGEFHDDLGYTQIDGKNLCDDCLAEYQSEQLRKSITR